MRLNELRPTDNVSEASGRYYPEGLVAHHFVKKSISNYAERWNVIFLGNDEHNSGQGETIHSAPDWFFQEHPKVSEMHDEAYRIDSENHVENALKWKNHLREALNMCGEIR